MVLLWWEHITIYLSNTTLIRTVLRSLSNYDIFCFLVAHSMTFILLFQYICMIRKIVKKGLSRQTDNFCLSPCSVPRPATVFDIEKHHPQGPWGEIHLRYCMTAKYLLEHKYFYGFMIYFLEFSHILRFMSSALTGPVAPSFDLIGSKSFQTGRIYISFQLYK